MNTKYCVNCGGKADYWTGHVHTNIGNICAGHCNICNDSGKDLVSYCTSINPDSCYGYRDIDQLELTEELTTEVLIRHARSQEFSNRVDNAVRGIPFRKVYSSKKVSLLERIINHIFS